MSYSLRYGVSRYEKRKKTSRCKKYFIVLGVLISVILLQVIFPSQLSEARRYVLPFLEPNVQEAFTNMAESINAGSSLGESVAVFCREIISEAVC